MNESDDPVQAKKDFIARWLLYKHSQKQNSNNALAVDSQGLKFSGFQGLGFKDLKLLRFPVSRSQGRRVSRFLRSQGLNASQCLKVPKVSTSDVIFVCMTLCVEEIWRWFGSCCWGC